MAFKKMNDYNEEKFGSLFLLRNDGDYADVVFLYRNLDDVLIADTHYIKSANYSGYVHCCGRNCPACAKGIRVQTKLFIPMYNITSDRVEFWDRSVRFENQLSSDVFERYPNPVDFVFRITRHGAAGDVNTTYQIVAVGRNSQSSYQDILNKFNISMPDHYSTICKEFSNSELFDMLNVSVSTSDDSLPAYQVRPRGYSAAPEAASPAIPAPEAVVDPSSEDELEDLDEPNF